MHKSILRFASFCTLRNLADSGETVAFSSTISPKLTVVSFRPFAHLAILKENVCALSNERDASSFFAAMAQADPIHSPHNTKTIVKTLVWLRMVAAPI